MKRETLLKRLAKQNISKCSIAYKMAIGLYTGEVIRPCHTSGSGRFTSNQDHTQELCALLDKLNVKYTHGNDSARGGLCGNWVKIKTNIK